MRLKFLVTIAVSLSLLGFKEKQKSTSAKEEDVATYFSIKDFFKDQWNTRRGSPYTLLRIVTLNGKTDSAFVDLDSTLWFSLKAKFDAADIGDRKFLDQYNFDLLEDDVSETRYLHYEAKNPELFMRKMDIGADQFTNLVKSVYIETREGGKAFERSQKLQYIPDRIFQIQEYEKSAAAPEKNLKIEYRYNY
jgi:hypothetical protein